MNIDLALISVVEGVTEFLPISSTAHLILLAKITSVELADPLVKFYLLFIQFGALLAGASLFAKKIFTDKKTFINICISFVPTAIVGFLLYKAFKSLLEGNIVLLASMLLIGGLIFIYLEKVFMKKNLAQNLSDNISEFGKNDISKKDAFIVGLAQAVAIVPGVSRSGATIIAGIFMGIKKSVIFEYTFMLALPTLGAAVLYDAYKSRSLLNNIESVYQLISGLAVSFIVAWITLYILKKYIPKISLTGFGIYRIVLSLAVLAYFYVVL